MSFDKILIGTDGDEDVKLWVGLGGHTWWEGPLVGSDLKEMIIGKKGNDALKGGGNDDTLYGDEGYDHLDGEAGNDTLYGGTEDDNMYGAEGYDTLYGGTGHDEMSGGSGDDTLYGENDNDKLWGGAGKDNLHGGSGFDNLLGGDQDDWLYGDAGADVLLGEAGNDVLIGGTGADQMDGGTGDDTYHLDHVVDMIIGDAAGYDVAYAYTNVDLGKMAGGKGIEKLVANNQTVAELTGSVGNNEIVGNLAANILRGGGGADVLDGGAGADKMYGQTGADTYVVDNAGDVVDETGGDGVIDTVRLITTAFSLANAKQTVGAVENLVFAGSGGFNISLTGNGLNNLLDASKSWSSKLSGGMGKDTLLGGIGDDQLDGGSDIDLMKGGAGNDNYFVDGSAEKVVEAAGGGTDTVRTYVDFTLEANVENGIVLDTLGLTLKGNAGVNTLTGNEGDDRLYGYGGADRLVGGVGADVLDGGAGNDTMEGGVFGDVYYVDSMGDKVVEVAAQYGGDDEVRVRLDYYELGAQVENLEGLLASDFTGIGNSLDNRLQSDDGKDQLYGLDGHDELIGYGDADSLYGGIGNDVLHGGAGGDQLYGGLDFDIASYEGSLAGVIVNLHAQTAMGGEAAGDKLSMMEGVIGSNGGDMLWGHSGIDRLDGREGDDVVYGSLGADELKGGAAVDQLNYSGSNAAVNVNLKAGGAAGGHAQGDTISGFENATGSAQGDTIVGTDGGSVLYGLSGNDKLFGLGGADTIVGGLGDDELNGGGGDDSVDGSDGNDVLRGSSGKDTLRGGTGVDKFVFETGLAANNVDKVADFDVATETLYLDNAAFKAFATPGAILAGNFRANTTGQAQDGDDRIVYDKDGGGLFYDADGLGATSGIQFATIGINLALTSADFTIV